MSTVHERIPQPMADMLSAHGRLIYSVLLTSLTWPCIELVGRIRCQIFAGRLIHDSHDLFK